MSPAIHIAISASLSLPASLPARLRRRGGGEPIRRRPCLDRGSANGVLQDLSSCRGPSQSLQAATWSRSTRVTRQAPASTVFATRQRLPQRGQGERCPSPHFRPVVRAGGHREPAGPLATLKSSTPCRSSKRGFRGIGESRKPSQSGPELLRVSITTHARRAGPRDAPIGRPPVHDTEPLYGSAPLPWTSSPSHEG